MPATSTEDRVARRERRQERRQKQREANAGRAQKMHQARLAQTRPAEPQDSLAALHIGCSGWFYWHWRGKFYPTDVSTNEWFDYYAKRFKTVELNAPFYSWPTEATVKTWVRQVKRRRFVYTVKVCELITHIKRFQGTKTLVQDFGYIADLLGPHMGCFLFQLPPSFEYTPARLKKIVGRLDRQRRNVVEFRHASWWNEEVFGAFREHGIIFCSCSAPRLPGELIKTADEIYVRFHGTTKWYSHDYSKAELAQWAERIKASGAKRVWAYFNNDHEAYAIKNARQLIRLLA
jgi:uncharacterized protein YecE (DUF72 family)